MSPTERLTRELIVDQLLRNVAMCMGDEDVPVGQVVKVEQIVEENGEKLKRQTAEAIVVTIRNHDAQGANRALELLDKQLDKLREDEANRPKEADGKGEDAGEYLSAAIQAKVDGARKILGSKFKESA